MPKLLSLPTPNSPTAISLHLHPGSLGPPDYPHTILLCHSRGLPPDFTSSRVGVKAGYGTLAGVCLPGVSPVLGEKASESQLAPESTHCALGVVRRALHISSFGPKNSLR